MEERRAVIRPFYEVDAYGNRIKSYKEELAESKKSVNLDIDPEKEIAKFSLDFKLFRLDLTLNKFPKFRK